MDEFKQVINKYKTLDDQIKEVNKVVNELRERRKIVELEMIDYLRSPQFANVNKLKIESDNSMIKIDRNATKSWYMSKGDLSKGINEYFSLHNNYNSDDCFNFIMNRQLENLKSNEFLFTRTLPKEEE